MVNTTCTRIFTVCLRCRPHKVKKWMLLVAPSCSMASFMLANPPISSASWPAQSWVTSIRLSSGITFSACRHLIAVSSYSNGALDMVPPAFLRLNNDLLAIWQAIVLIDLCIFLKIYDTIQYLINKFFHSLPDWISYFFITWSHFEVTGWLGILSVAFPL